MRRDDGDRGLTYPRRPVSGRALVVAALLGVVIIIGLLVAA